MSSALRHLIRRLSAHWPVKFWLGGVLSIVYCAGYFWIERHPFRSPMRLSTSAIDRAIPFQPAWVWVYQSLYLLLPSAWLCQTLDQLRRFAIGFTCLTLPGFACFLFWPVAGPRPAISSGNPMYAILVRYDTALNCFPSMHMALATFSACVAIGVSVGSLRRALIVILPVWVILIGYSALAIKQHYCVDLAPGILLGWAAHYVAWRIPTAKINTSAEMLASEGSR